MSLLIALALMALEQNPAPGAEPEQPAAEAAEAAQAAQAAQAVAREHRQAAALLLRQSAQGTEGQAAIALPALIQGATQAARELPGTRVCELLDQALLAARWQATVDPAGALEQLARRTLELSDDLDFQPLIEAPLPAGFPLPTAIHELELKRYPRYRLAQTAMDNSRQNGAFWRLFGHIKAAEIPMTAPVETTFDDAGQGAKEVRMAFLYEGPDQGPELSTIEGVQVETVPPMTVISLGCRGNDSAPRIETALALFDTWLATHPDYQRSGPPRVFGYNSPMVRGTQRTFEVQLPVQRIEPAL